jgi:geranylgeranyl diphosphate synthase type II
MDAVARIERALSDALALTASGGCPPRLAEAMHHAVFPRGARVRPRLVLAVAAACGGDDPRLTDAAAAAIELLHCASLVHDDLPCFDDAETRRGRPSVHRAHGEPLAVLAGDALIVLAFQALARTGGECSRVVALTGCVGGAVGVPRGIVAGQAWECERLSDIAEYHRQKTGALFAGAAMAGALSAGREGDPWRAFGALLGEAYQAADDIGDAAGEAEEMGKPTGRDAALGRPSWARELGIPGAVRRLQELAGAAVAAIPPCPGAGDLKALVMSESRRLLPKRLDVAAA